MILFEIKSFCSDIVMCDLVHDMRAIYGLSKLHSASGTLFGIISGTRGNENCNFQEKLIFQKRFPDAVRS